MEELNDFTEEREESNFDLKAEIFKYLTHWKWIVLGLLIGGLVAYLYNRYTIPKYRTEATLVIADDDEKTALNAMGSGTGSILSLNNDGLDNQIEKLRSKSLIESVVDELDHNIAYYIEGNVITVEAYKSSPVIIEFITTDSLVNSLDVSLFVTPVSDTEFRLVEESRSYNKNHKIGEVIEIDGIQFIILPCLGNEEGSYRNTNTVHIKISAVSAVARQYSSVLQIAKKGQGKYMLVLSLIKESEKES